MRTSLRTRLRKSVMEYPVSEFALNSAGLRLRKRVSNPSQVQYFQRRHIHNASPKLPLNHDLEVFGCSSEMASNPPGQCCIIGFKHEGEALGSIVKVGTR